MRKIGILLFVLQNTIAFGQVTGGQNTLSFLNVANSAHQSAMGGMCVSSPSDDILLGLSNPALIRPELSNQLGSSINFYYGGTKITNLLYSQYSPKWKACIAGGITFVNYGTLPKTLANGTYSSEMHASDYALQISASKKYLNKWRYGATLKYAHSHLSELSSAAIIADAGLIYYNPEKEISWSLVAKNFGGVLKKYDQNVLSSPLPYDVRMGVSKKFLKAPFRLNVIAHHLYQWDTRYNNPADITTNELFIDTNATRKTKSYFADKLFRHFNFSIDLLLGKRIEATFGYSHQRRSELALSDKKGLSGFSYGLGIDLNKFQIHYGRSIYNIAGAYNEISVNLKMKELFGIGKKMQGIEAW